MVHAEKDLILAVAPAIVAAICRLVEPQAQIDPTFESPLAFTRVTAQAVRDELLKDPALTPHVPCRQTVGNILNRLDYRLRPVIKARPQKKSTTRYEAKNPASRRQQAMDSTAKTGMYTALLSLVAGR